MSKVISNDIIATIIDLRQQGFSLPEIRNITKVGYGTVYKYIKNVEILAEYKSDWLGKRGGSKKRKVLADLVAFKKAQTSIQNLSEKEKLLLLTALYWGEGSKSDFGLSNTDPDLIKIFVDGLRSILKVNNADIKVSIRTYEDLDKSKCISFWAAVTGIPKEKIVSVNVLKGKKLGKHSHGMCRIRVRKGGNLLKYIVAIKKQVIQLFTDEISPRSSTDRAQVS